MKPTTLFQFVFSTFIQGSHVSKSNKFPRLRINVYGDEQEIFIRHQSLLAQQGYEVTSLSSMDDLDTRPLPDISIIGLAGLAAEQKQALTDSEHPYLVYNFNDASPLIDVYDRFLDNAVGYFVDVPSIHDISVKIELGLMLFDERQKVNKRLSDIDQKFESNRTIGIATGLVMAIGKISPSEAFEFLRKIARNQRCRVADVSKILIAAQTNRIEHEHFDNLSIVKDFLERNVSVEHTRQ